jgi:hypothetical protein
MRGLQYKEIIFYLKKDNAAEEAVPSFAIEEMGPVCQSHSMTLFELLLFRTIDCELNLV